VYLSTTIDAWSLANSINPEHLSEDEIKEWKELKLKIMKMMY